MTLRRPSWLFGREAEWASIAGFLGDDLSGAGLGLVYGRRRTGKTFLLQAAVEASRGVYLAAIEGTQRVQLDALAEQLRPHATLGAPRLDSWTDLWHALLALSPSEARPRLVVLDEFPYLLGPGNEAASTLQAALAPRSPDRLASASRLVLCGSAVGTMRSLLDASAPLRGRSSLEIVVDAFDPRTARRFAGIDDPALAARTHAVVGGVPAYMREFVGGHMPGPHTPFDAWITGTVLDPGRPLLREADVLLGTESSLRDLGLHRSILTAVAGGARTPTEIGGRVGRDRGALDALLTALASTGFVVGEEDLLRQRGRRWRLADPFLHFASAIITPNAHLLTRPGRAAAVWPPLRSTFEAQVLGPHFEQLARSYCSNDADHLFDALPAQVGFATITDASARSSHEIDVFVRGAGQRRPVLAIGEAKWGERLSDAHVHRLVHIRDVLGRSGHDVQHCRLLLFSGAGQSKITERSGATVIDLPTLYGDAG